MIRLRPHHLLCSQGFCGSGYSEDFTGHMAGIVSCLRKVPVSCLEEPWRPERESSGPEAEGRPFLLLSGSDDICSACPHRQADGLCESESHIADLDRRVLEAFDLSSSLGSTLDYQAVEAYIRKRMTPSLFASICGDCSWYQLGICRDRIVPLLKPSKL